MIDISSEKLLTFSQAAEKLPSRPHTSALHRWTNSGIRGIKLETILIGGRRFTSWEALQRFVEATTEESNNISIQKAKNRARKKTFKILIDGFHISSHIYETREAAEKALPAAMRRSSYGAQIIEHDETTEESNIQKENHDRNKNKF